MVLIDRMIQGIGTGIILPLMFTIAMLIFPPNKLGTVNGVLALVIMFAPAIGPTLTGLILAAGSWRDIFFTFVVFLVIAFVIGLFSLKNVSQITKPKVDFVSIILSIFAFSGLIAGASFASEMGWLSVPVLACLIVGVIALIFYVRRQLKLEVPVLIDTATSLWVQFWSWLILVSSCQQCIFCHNTCKMVCLQLLL